MGSYDNIVKIEEMRKKAEEGDLLSAQKILDTMDIEKVKNISDLNLMAEVFKENERYDEAAELYYKIYEKYQTRRTICNLVDISIKLGNLEDAEEFLVQYRNNSQDDFDGYVFRYRIDKMKGVSYDRLIQTLEALNKLEYTEKWEYELAKLYYKAGMEEQCIRKCSDIILWFGEGAYVEKAKMLRSYYSGEEGKEQILEELKRRAELAAAGSDNQDEGLEASDSQNADDSKNESDSQNEADGQDVADSQEELYQDAVMDQDADDSQNASDEMEEQICAGSDFMAENETQDLEDGLKHEIRNILTGEGNADNEEAVSVQKENNEVNSGEEPDRIDKDKDNYNVQTDASAEDETVQDDEPADFMNSEEQTSAAISMPVEAAMDEDDSALNHIVMEQQIDVDEIFGNFLHVSSIRNQLVQCLDKILQEGTSPVFMIITGSEGTGKTALAKAMAIFLNQTGRIKSSKVAKITAGKLNRVDLTLKKDLLRSCCIVIDHAGELKHETISSLQKLTEYLDGDMAVVFEDDQENMNKMLDEFSEFTDIIKNQIHLPQYTQEDLMGFAYACLKQNEYELDQDAEALLQDKVNQIAKKSAPQGHLEQIYHLIHSLMEASETRTGEQLISPSLEETLQDLIVHKILPEDFRD